MSVRNPLALLGFAALCVLSAVALLLHGDPVPDWLAALPQLSLFGSAAVMTPGLNTAKQLLTAGTLPGSPVLSTLGKEASPRSAPTGTAAGDATQGLAPGDVEL